MLKTKLASVSYCGKSRHFKTTDINFVLRILSTEAGFYIYDWNKRDFQLQYVG